jgi:hypothetical protein
MARASNKMNNRYSAVFHIMEDRHWHTLAELNEATGDSDASVSSQLRDFRKLEFGGFTVEKRYKGASIRNNSRRSVEFEYRLEPFSGDRFVMQQFTEET